MATRREQKTPAVTDALAALDRASTKKDFDNLARFGIAAPKAFGVSMANIQKLARTYGRSHEFAAALWDSGWYEARTLAAYVDGGFEELADGEVRLRCRAADESRFYLLGSKHGAFDDLPSVTCPTTVVRGAPDTGPYAFAATVADRLAAGRLEEMPEVSHFGPMEDPVRIAASIRAASGRRGS